MSTKDEYVLKTRVAHPVTISLPVNKTAGFSWEIDFCDPALECRELPYRRHLGGLGAGGTQRFEVSVPRTGEFLIRLQLKRSWETKVKEVRTYRVIAAEEK